MSYDFTASESDYMSLSATYGGNFPFTMAAWIKVESVGGAEILSRHDDSNAGNGYNHVNLGINVGSDAIANVENIVATDVDAITTGSWQLIVGVFASDSSRTIYVDDRTGVENTTTRAIDAPDTIVIGARGYDAGETLRYFNGKISDVAIWNSALSAANVTSLWNSGSGADMDTVDSGNLVFYRYLRSDLTSGGYGATSPTNSGAALDTNDNPPMVGGASVPVATIQHFRHHLGGM
jgi:hypothetical protein